MTVVHTLQEKNYGGGENVAFHPFPSPFPNLAWGLESAVTSPSWVWGGAQSEIEILNEKADMW